MLSGIGKWKLRATSEDAMRKPITTSVMFLSEALSEFNCEKISDKPESGDILQKKWPVRFQKCQDHSKR